MTDTHCHLTFPQFDADPTSPTGLRGAGRDAVLSRAMEAGVMQIVNPGTDLEQSRAAVWLADGWAGKTPEILAAIGVHPHDVGGLTDESFAELKQLARHPRVVAVGEVGLERSERSPALDVQRPWLERFVALARAIGKPLIFHVRNAHREFREFLEQEWSASPAARNGLGVVHCFSGTLDDARWYIAHGLCLGITGIVTFPNTSALREVVRAVPLDRLLLETDAPFLAPQRYRGQRNEPAYVREVATAVADIKDVSVTDVDRVTSETAKALFRVQGT